MSPTLSEQELHILDFNKAEIYECGALLLTILALPEEIAEAKTKVLFNSLCAKALYLKHQTSPENGTPVSAQSEYLFHTVEKINRDVEFVSSRLGKRLEAGRMAIPFLRRAAELPVGLPQGVRRLSINEMAQFIQGPEGHGDLANIKARVWRSSRKVLHLCAALAMIGQERQRAGSPGSLETFLLDESFLRTVTSRAQEYADLIANDPKFPVSASSLIRVTCS